MDNVSSESTHNEIEWIETYATKASKLSPFSSNAQKVVKLLMASLSKVIYSMMIMDILI